MGTKCKYSGCTLSVEKYWAMVGVCAAHHELIKEETTTYYRGLGNLPYDQRKHFSKIAEFIPWSRFMKEDY